MKTHPDQILERIKNNKLVAAIIVVAVIVIGVANFKDALQKLGLSAFGQKKERKELVGVNGEQLHADLQRIVEQLKSAPPATKVTHQPLPQTLEEQFDHEMENLVKQGFAIAPNILTYLVKESEAIKLPLMVPVTHGLRHAVVACGNASIDGLQAIMLDEEGNLLDSDKGDRKVVVQTSSDYTGDVECFIQVKHVDGVGQINIATASRVPPEPSQSKRDVGLEPTFQMETSSPEATPQP
jgi:hypothetical protein